jgi:hypothetical protein
VIDDLGRNGRVYPETDVETADLETVIVDLLDGQYRNPIRVVAFNTAEGWSQDVSADVAQELRRRCDFQLRDVPSSIQDFDHGIQCCQPSLSYSIVKPFGIRGPSTPRDSLQSEQGAPGAPHGQALGPPQGDSG